MSKAPSRAAAYSPSTVSPAKRVPANATDCHIHIYDSTASTAPGGTPFIGDAEVEAYLKLRRRLGFGRTVLVQPSLYGADNAVLLCALQAFHRTARGIVVLNDGVTVATLRNWHEMGVRGVRINVAQGAAVTTDALENLVRRIRPLGWQIEFNLNPALLVELASLISRIPIRVTLDHVAWLPVAAHLKKQVTGAVQRLLAQGNVWVKVTPAFVGHRERDRHAIATLEATKLLVSEAPSRVVWGSDWPHPGTEDAPDDAWNLGLLAAAVPDVQLQSRILVDNADELFDFR